MVHGRGAGRRKRGGGGGGRGIRWEPARGWFGSWARIIRRAAIAIGPVRRAAIAIGTTTTGVVQGGEREGGRVEAGGKVEAGAGMGRITVPARDPGPYSDYNDTVSLYNDNDIMVSLYGPRTLHTAARGKGGGGLQGGRTIAAVGRAVRRYRERNLT